MPGGVGNELCHGCPWSFSILHVGTDQPYPRPSPDPNPKPPPHTNPNPNLSGGLEVDRGSRAAPQRVLVSFFKKIPGGQTAILDQ